MAAPLATFDEGTAMNIDDDSVPLDRDAFAARVMGLIQKHGANLRLAYEPEPFRIVSLEESKQILNLHNGYQMYMNAAPEDRANVIAKTAIAWRLPEDQLELGYESVVTDLHPAVRARSYFDLFGLELSLDGTKPPEVPHHEFAEFLSLLLVYDEPHTVSFVNAQQLEDWGVTFYEAYEAAVRNLAEKPIAYVESEGLFELCANDAHDAARMLLVEAMKSFEVTGDLICMVPSRDCLLLTGSDNSAGLRLMAERAREAIQSRMITCIAFRLVDDHWEPWLPQKNHPSYSAFHRLHCDSLGQDYVEQKALLEELHEKTGDDIFVATYSGVDAKDRSWTYTLWAENVLSLLPRAEYLVFGYGENQTIRFVPWDAAATIVGGMMHDTGMYPVRYRVEDFPTPEQLERLRAVAIEP